MSTVLLLSTSDTDLLAARASGASYRIANPTRVDAAEELPDLLRGVDVAVVRLLGGRRAWEGGLDALKSSGVPTVLLGGEAVPDAELMAESSVPSGVVAEALKYLVEGGPENLRQLACFLSDTVLMSGEGFEPPAAMPEFGVHGARERRPGRPTVGVLFYRAHELAGNTAFVDTLCEAIEDAGANALPVYCGSLRSADPKLYELLSQADALVLPSVMRESHSILTREALGAGTPVVTSDCVGPEEVVRHGVNGLIVPTGDVAALAAAIERVVTDRQLLLSLQDDEALRLFCDSVLGPLDDGEGHYGDELLRSLEVFIECNGQWEKAARRLYCHRHTLRYRIRRVEELTGRSLSSARDRIEFWLALRGRELV